MGGLDFLLLLQKQSSTDIPDFLIQNHARFQFVNVNDTHLRWLQFLFDESNNLITNFNYWDLFKKCDFAAFVAKNNSFDSINDYRLNYK